MPPPSTKDRHQGPYGVFMRVDSKGEGLEWNGIVGRGWKRRRFVPEGSVGEE